MRVGGVRADELSNDPMLIGDNRFPRNRGGAHFDAALADVRAFIAQEEIMHPEDFFIERDLEPLDSDTFESFADFVLHAEDGAWAAYLDGATHKQLCQVVREQRAEMRHCTREQRRVIGRILYDIQGTLKSRFGVDIAKVR